LSSRLKSLETLVAILRGPDGCPWDQEQTLSDIRPYLLEEAHEVAAAIDSENWTELREELGDLLFHIVFVAHLAKEAGEFDLDAVISQIRSKMIERHPHVFGEQTLSDPRAVRAAWENRKARDPKRSLLEGVPPSLPALIAAYRMTQKAAGVGFDWPSAESVVDKVHEELEELKSALEGDPARLRTDEIREETGDLLFTLANLARLLEIDPEAALAAANRKFRRRFQAMEKILAEQNRNFEEVSGAELEEIWKRVKTKREVE
jgi:MazG family protein